MSDIKKKIFEIARTSTFKSTGIVTSATVVNGFLGFVFYWLLARIWGFNPEYLGLFTIASATSSLIVDIATIGTDTGIVNFVGRYIKSDPDKAKRFLKLALIIKLVVSFIVLVVGWFLVPIAAQVIFQKSVLIIPLRIALIGVLSGLLFNFTTSSLQAIQKFLEWGLVNIFSNAARLIFVYMLFTIGLLTVNSGLIVYIPITLTAFLLSLFILPKFLNVKNTLSVSRDFFNYNKWVAIFTIIAAVSSRLDVFLVTKTLSLKDVGVYSVAITLSGIVPQLVGAIGTVIAPKLASFKSKQQTKDYLKKLQLFVAVLSLVGIFSGSIVGYIFISKFYSEVYFTSFYPFVILLVAQAVFLLSVPVHMAVIYYFSYPKLFVYISIINLSIILVLGYILVNSLGLVGISFAVLLGNSVNFIIPAIWVIRKFRE